MTAPEVKGQVLQAQSLEAKITDGPDPLVELRDLQVVQPVEKGRVLLRDGRIAGADESREIPRGDAVTIDREATAHDIEEGVGIVVDVSHRITADLSSVCGCHDGFETATAALEGPPDGLGTEPATQPPPESCDLEVIERNVRAHPPSERFSRFELRAPCREKVDPGSASDRLGRDARADRKATRWSSESRRGPSRPTHHTTLARKVSRASGRSRIAAVSPTMPSPVSLSISPCL